MKYRIRVCLLVLTLCLVCLTGCHRTMNSVIQNEPRFAGKVQSATEDYVVVEVLEDEPLHEEYATIEASLDVELKDSYCSPVLGDEIVVYYDGTITDGRAETVYAITLQSPS